MFFVTTDQNDMTIAIVIAHILALVEVDDPAGAITRVITSGQVGDDAQSFFLG